jgi:hypothetical protein
VASPPPANGEDQFRKYCRTCPPGELLSLLKIYPEAIDNNEREIDGHRRDGNEVEVQRAAVRMAENKCRLRITCEVARERNAWNG